MPISTSTTTKTVSALIAVAVIVSLVTIGGVAQTDSEDGDASDGDAEPNDSIANATRIQYGQEIEANLSSPSDVDYYAINASAGDAIIPRIRTENNNSATEVDLVTPNGEVTTELTNDVASGSQNFACRAGGEGYTGNVMEFDGTYYVRVRSVVNLYCPDLNESATYRYNLTVNRTSLDEHEPNENGSTATTLELGETVNATYVGYDSDVYAVNLTAGRNYTVYTSAPSSAVAWVYGNESHPVDDPFWPYSEDNSSPYSQAMDRQNNSTVATSDPIGSPGAVSFTPEENKTYYVQIMQGWDNGNLLMQKPYEITVRPTDGTPSDDDGAGEPDSPDDEDADSDGLTNTEEETLGTDPRNVDTDDDGLTDGQEVTEYGTDPLSGDTDDDGLTDECELRNDTDPTNPDTDGDGTLDGEEV